MGHFGTEVSRHEFSSSLAPKISFLAIPAAKLNIAKCIFTTKQYRIVSYRIVLNWLNMICVVAGVTPLAYVQKESLGMAETTTRKTGYKERWRKEKTEIVFSSHPVVLVRICFVILKRNKITLNNNWHISSYQQLSWNAFATSNKEAQFSNLMCLNFPQSKRHFSP